MNAPVNLSLFADPQPSWQEQAARRERLTCEETVRAQMERSIAAITAIARQGHTLKAGVSGKDSTLVLCLAVEALRRMKDAGEVVPRLWVVTADTQIENPEVALMMRQVFDSVGEFAADVGLDVRCEMTQPRLSEDYLVRIIGGDTLPSFLGGQAKCSIGMKVSPLSRAAKRIDRELAAAGLPPSVTLLGTRFAESSKRKANMTGRGDSADTPRLNDIGGYSCLVMSPIADWQTETVFAYLRDAGRKGKKYPGFADSFDGLYGLYDAASGGNCVVYVDPSMQSRTSGGCSARFGCWLCTMVGVEHSMKNMLMLPEFAYMRGLYRLREYLQKTRFDFSRRRWFGRTVDPKTGDLMLSVATYSAAECADLLRMVLTIDKRERQRAARVAAELKAGKIPATPANRLAAEVRFQCLSNRQIAAIDYLWGLNASHAPHQAWRILLSVQDGSGEMDVPDVEAVPRGPVPAHRILPGVQRLWDMTSGLLDVTLAMSYFEPEGWTHTEVDGVIEPIPQMRDAPVFEVDEESLEMFLQFELEDRLRDTEGQDARYALTAARFYHRYGLIGYSHSMAHLVQRRMERAEYWLSFGLAGDLSLPELMEKTIPMPITQAPASVPELPLFEAA